MTKHDLPAIQRSLRDIIDEYVTKRDAIPALIEAFGAQCENIKMQTSVGGQYGGSVFARYVPSLNRRDCEAVLLKSAWKLIYDGLNIATVAPAKDRAHFKLFLENPPDLTLDAVREAFGDYLVSPRFFILKGLAEAFAGLDPAFKSHSKVKVGVSRLPKRIIMEHALGSYGRLGYGGERLRDVINAIRVYEGRPHINGEHVRRTLERARKNGPTSIDERLTVKAYQNGNAHLIFAPEKLLSVNLGISEFYGEVLPDVNEDGTTAPKASTAVSRDLQFYPTPKEVINQVLRKVYLKDGARVLEPSCGDGRLMAAIQEAFPGAHVTGIECHGGRAMEARAKGLNVVIDNFLDVPPTGDMDYVIANPPFYGLHWKKHLDHALRFLKHDGEGRRTGRLVFILPATAYYDGHLDTYIEGIPHYSDLGWTDLPVGSFSESGTNVPTGYLYI